MSPDSLHNLTAHEAADLLGTRETSSEELTRAYLDRIQAVEERVKAYVTVLEAGALEQAKQADRRRAAGEGGPLSGVPMQLKDNLSTNGVTTTCSSRMLKDFVPPYDATVVGRLRQAGAVFLGKGNMDEFAMGSSTETSAFFPTHNPWGLDRVPGGSSGGPAAAVAADEAAYSLGSDTGGSIRQPAALCGVVGLKPTYGLVSRYGLIAFASSLDQIGPMTKDVTDSALVLNAIAGNDPMDSTSAPQQPTDYTQALVPDVKGMRLGVPKEYFVEGMDPRVTAAVEAAIASLEDMGASVDREVSLPTTPYALAVYYIIAPSEASANLARYDGVKFGYLAEDTQDMWEAMEHTRQQGFGAEVKRRIMLGTYALSAGYYDAYYLRAQKVRTLISQEFKQVFERYDALLAPTSPSVAFRLGERMDDPMQMYLSDVCTIPANIAGIPGISVPCGFVDGLPVGLQVLGPHFGEQALFRIAYAYEQAHDWNSKRPNL